MKRLTLASIALLPSLCAAQSDIVITITGYPISAEKALVPTETFEAEDIRNSTATDVGDLLRQANGLELGRNGGPGQASSLFFRGTDSDHNLVMIDDVPINTATVASASLGTIDTQLLQRIEVVKGPQSTLWGSGAIGGVVNISTLSEAALGDHAFASASYGGNNTRRAAVGFTHADEATQLSLGISHHSSDGIPTLSIAENASGYENTSFNIGAAQQLGKLKLQASHWQTQGRSEYQSFTYPAPTFTLQLVPVSQDFLTSVSSLSLKGQPLAATDSTLQLSLARDHIDQNDSADFAHTDRTTLAWRNVRDMNSGDKLSFGAEAIWEKAAIESFGSSYSGTTDSQGAYVQYDGTRQGHQWLGGARLLQHEDAGRHLTWNLGYGYQLSEATRLKANLSTGFRYPTAVERYVFSPNPDLRPEHSRAVELGLRHRLARQRHIDLSLFRTDIDDLIVSQGVFPNTINVNVNQARITGLEASYQASQGPWQFKSSLILQNPRDRSNDTQLLRRARVSAKASVDYDRDKLHAGLELIYSGERRDVDGITFAPTTTGAYTLVNLNAALDLSPQLQLFGKAENLFDTDYQLVSQYNTPGRTLFAGIRYQTP